MGKPKLTIFYIFKPGWSTYMVMIIKSCVSIWPNYFADKSYYFHSIKANILQTARAMIGFRYSKESVLNFKRKAKSLSNGSNDVSEIPVIRKKNYVK